MSETTERPEGGITTVAMAEQSLTTLTHAAKYLRHHGKALAKDIADADDFAESYSDADDVGRGVYLVHADGRRLKGDCESIAEALERVSINLRQVLKVAGIPVDQGPVAEQFAKDVAAYRARQVQPEESTP